MERLLVRCVRVFVSAVGGRSEEMQNGLVAFYIRPREYEVANFVNFGLSKVAASEFANFRSWPVARR